MLLVLTVGNYMYLEGWNQTDGVELKNLIRLLGRPMPSCGNTLAFHDDYQIEYQVEPAGMNGKGNHKNECTSKTIILTILKFKH